MSQKPIIEFPCHFPIKIIGNHTETFQNEITDILHDHAIEPYKPEITSKISKEGNYLAITVTVYVESQESLDRIYQAVTKHPDIKMVL